MKEKMNILGVSSGFCGNLNGSKKAPEILKQRLQGHLTWHDFIHEDHFQHPKPFEKIFHLSQALATKSHELISKEKHTLFFGGDHSVAIGTWKGAMQAKKQVGDIGLLWVDAHMDAHTPETTESGNIHGMPVATLLGYGNKNLTSILSSIALKPKNICLVGIRSYESGEYNLLQKLGVKIYFIDEVLKRGFDTVLKESISYISKNTVGFGMSFDLDSLDPYFAPGVSTPVSGGLPLDDCLKGLKLLQTHPNLIATEIVEYNPEFDKDHKTVRTIQTILNTLYPHHFLQLASR